MRIRPFLQARSIRLWFGIAVGVLSWISILSYWSTSRLVGSYDQVSTAYQALGKFQHIEMLMEAAESSVRGYLISGDPAGLEPYRYAKLVVPYNLRQIQSLLTFRPERIVTLRSLGTHLADHIAYLSTLIDLRKSQGYAAAAAAMARESGTHRQTMERLLSQIHQEELIQLNHRWGRASRQALTSKAILVSATLMTLILLGWVFSLLRREADERRQAENTTQRTETFLHSILERIPYMILVKEATNLRFTLANKTAEEWLGRSNEDLLNANELDLRPKDEAIASIQKDREVLADGKQVEIPEERLALPGKEERVLHTQKIPVPDEHGNPAFLLTISEDITRRQQAQRLLEHSRDAAVEAARLRSEFIRNMSHEFRTPLSLVIGMTSLVLDTELTPEQRRFTETVRRAAEGLSVLTKSILDFSKIEAGTFMLETRELNVRHVVEDVVTMLDAQAKAKGVALVSLVYNEIPSVLRGDPVRLRQVLTQLIGNAVKFTERGEIVIRVTEEKQTETQLWLHCRITDTGIGIPQDIQAHLFEAFRQGDGSRTRRYGGTGLGLAISKRIVELMGGSIGCDSVAGQGSTFWFSIPLNKRHVHGPTVQVGSMPWTRARVLVISENDTYRQLIKQHLSDWTIASETVTSGQAALELLHHEQMAGRPFPIALLDMHLSDMDGVAFARAVKNDAALSTTKLLVMTGSDASLDAGTAVPLGFSGWIPMPPKPEELYERLAGLIEPNPPTRRQHAA